MDDERIESILLGERMVKATRKPHPCYQCPDEIPAGSHAFYVAYLIDGDFWAGYSHGPVPDACPKNAAALIEETERMRQLDWEDEKTLDFDPLVR